MTRFLAQFGTWFLVAAAVMFAAALPLGSARADDPDEFAVHTQPRVALGSVVRVNRHPLSEAPGNWRATAAGVVVAPGVVVTLRSLTAGLQSDEDLQVISGLNSYTATVNTEASDDDLVVLNVTNMPISPARLADTPIVTGAAVTAAGFAMVLTQGEGDTRRWNITPTLLNGTASVGEGVTHNMETGYGYGGGALLDGCGHVVGILTDTLEEDGARLQTAVGLERLRALLRAANVTTTDAPGWCAPQETVNRVRAARQQVARNDVVATAAFSGGRQMMQILETVGRFVAIGLGAAALIGGVLGSITHLTRRGDPARPRAKVGFALVFAGAAVAGVGLAADPIAALLRPQMHYVQLTCTYDAARSRQASGTRAAVSLNFDPQTRCRSGGGQGSDLHYAVGIAEPGSRDAAFIRTIRPAAVSSQMGPGRPSIIETHAFSQDLSRYDIRRYVLPPELYPSVQRVFMARNNQQTCRTPQAADQSQAERRRFVLAYAEAPGSLVSHTAFTCRRQEAAPESRTRR